MRIGVDVPELALLLGALFIIQRRQWQGWAELLVAPAVLSRLKPAIRAGAAFMVKDERAAFHDSSS